MKFHRYLTVILASLALFGCATKFAYNNIDWFIISYIDDLVPLSSAQESELENRLEVLQQWHKKTQLPLYIQQINDFQQQQRQTITAEFIEQQSNDIRTHIRSIVTEFSPDIYALSLQLSPKQDQTFLKNFKAKQQEYYDERLSLEDKEAREFYSERVKKRVERWLGDITPQQDAIIKNWAEEWVNTNQDWYQYQQNTYQAVSDLVERKADLPFVQMTTMQLLLDNASYYPDTLPDKLKSNNEISAKYLVQIAQSSNDTQWQHFMDELGTLKSTLIDLQK
ncbi:DNA polymerase III subunit alpha [Vibrio sp. D404a]|uniref:DUF6279 family lipoprotein n=1 Tax=unclassified Vibrio TaxID=2614977 RepID=UPI0025549836|nr:MULTISPECIES: DUF6279 family lipoprotein [unclassified Vibrio]MDK9736345.1 DNA polymerase III subunit alpha [Vibrio sp. D404a]MDK9795967.1 DNA polymerase III subunit alpha [Vibrio sp. D449a]